MTTITIAFTPEGSTDERFLSSIIARTVEDLLMNYGRKEFNVLPPMPFKRAKGESSGAERLLDVARQAFGYHLLIIHADADDSNQIRAYNERINPGLILINADTSTCKEIAPLVPVYMTESWMLADHHLLSEALNTKLDIKNDLKIPKPSKAENIANPKQLLEEAIHQVDLNRGKRRRTRLNISDLYSQLSEISIEKLRSIPSFINFQNNLTVALRSLNFID